MNINLSNIENISNSLEESMNQVKSSFESDWDDPVHDSYYGYIEQCQNCMNCISKLVEDVINLGAECENIDIDSINTEFQSIRAVVDSF